MEKYCSSLHSSVRHSSTLLELTCEFSGRPLWIDCWYTPSKPLNQLTRPGSVISDSFVQCMHDQDLTSLSLSFVASLKACGQTKDLKKGSELHAEISSSGLLATNSYVGNMLISMYAKCGAFAQAQQVLYDLQVRDEVSWSALISGFAQSGHAQEALECYKHMKIDGHSPDAITYASVLKACGIIQDLDKGKQIHDELVSQGLLGKSIVLGSGLVDMYAKCGVLTKAKEVLDELPERNSAAWSAIISGYVHAGNGIEALSCYQKMRTIGLNPCAYTYSCILKICGTIRALDMGESIYKEVVGVGLLQDNIVVGTAAVDMYAKLGMPSKAQEVFDQLPMRSAICWNALIAGYVQSEKCTEAINCYEQMQSEGVLPDVTTYACILKACGIIGAIERGKKVHDELASQGLLMESRVLGNALVDMYARCGLVSIACHVLIELPNRDIVSWSTLIGGYAEFRQGEEALLCYKQLQREGFSPNAITYVSILKACSITHNTHQGKQVHKETVSKGLIDKNILICNSLLHMYANCGLYYEARNVLLSDVVIAQNVSSWNALLSGYAQNENGDEILFCHEEMQCKGVAPDVITYACILKACSITKEVNKGKDIHNEIVSQGLLGNNHVLGNALINMYAKCGMLQRAHQVLEELSHRNVIAWSALIAGYAQRGQPKEALDCFFQMQNEGLSPDTATWNTIISGFSHQGRAEEALRCFHSMECRGVIPDAITLVCVLNACSHSGLIDKGESYFENMSRDYGILPDTEHQACIIDLFARLGCFDRALKILSKVSSSAFPSVWSSVLGACKKWGNLMLGKVAFEHSVS